ncbi:hypothetical protein MNBD_CPR01-87 [hydrothermal vent metagenome]|uniref:Ribulose-phosphate 3-epimerase n=1 Tax=hydrothermal vent metagenome TaxID=652676 RepID=A0A3B0VJY6_9ZZZZ
MDGMDVIVPAILVETLAELEEKLERVSGLAGTIQIDVVDGVFAGPPTWPYVHSEDMRDFKQSVNDGKIFSNSSQPILEVDLMVSFREEIVAMWVALGASRITIHARSVDNLSDTFRRLSETFGSGKNFSTDMLLFGVALGSEDDISILEPVLDKIDYVQCMGIRNIGKQGEPFDDSVIDKVSTLHTKYPDMPVQVDGGVSFLTAPKLLSVGASRIIIGSAIWYSTDIKERIKEFQDLSLRYGLYT